MTEEQVREFVEGLDDSDKLYYWNELKDGDYYVNYMDDLADVYSGASVFDIVRDFAGNNNFDLSDDYFYYSLQTGWPVSTSDLSDTLYDEDELIDLLMENQDMIE